MTLFSFQIDEESSECHEQLRHHTEDIWEVASEPSVMDIIRDAMSVFSIDYIRETTSDLISLLSKSEQDDEEIDSIRDTDKDGTSDGGNPGTDLNENSRSASAVNDVQTTIGGPSSNRIDNDVSLYSDYKDDCIACGVADRLCYQVLGSIKSDCALCCHGCTDGTLTCSTRTELTGNTSHNMVETQSCLF